ncbi:hypothetical protein TNCT_19211 [Trichonephila clavata]|uniref:Uncharacterized protein n=1 Tax=Trichonephila clavata TaxID=2740835 RepID=A0A8X6G808_TRICU|nr:hypothetical protein TNCT_19211 [Trichonephila clavata]
MQLKKLFYSKLFIKERALHFLAKSVIPRRQDETHGNHQGHVERMLSAALFWKKPLIYRLNWLFICFRFPPTPCSFSSPLGWVFPEGLPEGGGTPHPLSVHPRVCQKRPV